MNAKNSSHVRHNGKGFRRDLVTSDKYDSTQNSEHTAQKRALIIILTHESLGVAKKELPACIVLTQ